MGEITECSGRVAVVLLSGGLDSMVSAGLAREAGYRICALTIDYNQRHRREIEAARVIPKRTSRLRHDPDRPREDQGFPLSLCSNQL